MSYGLGIFLTPARAVYGRLGAWDDPIDDFATAFRISPVEAPREPSFWEGLLARGIEAVPTAITKGVEAYGIYETAGGGQKGFQTALFNVTGVPQPAAAPPPPPPAPPAAPWSTEAKVAVAAGAGLGLWLAFGGKGRRR